MNRHTAQRLEERLASGDARVAVLGLGYVGLPLAVAASKRFRVLGFDINARLVHRLNHGGPESTIVRPQAFRAAIKGNLSVTNEPRLLRGHDAFVVCVPTPLQRNKAPDLGPVKQATSTIGRSLARPALVILESTSFPGTTDEIVKPILESKGRILGEDFFLAYSPERIDPGNTKYTLANTPKIVGGCDAASLKLSTQFYRSVISAPVHPVSSASTAEAVKMLENIFRGVNIALANEMALILERLGISYWEVVDAASTKPYAFMPHYPGPGIGGHCIPLDPFYMAYKARQIGMVARFIQLSGEINEFMPFHAVNLVERGLGRVGRPVRGSKILVAGLSYKAGVADTRESPSIHVIDELVHRGAEVLAHDPRVRTLETETGTYRSRQTLDEALKAADCVVFMVNHPEYARLKLHNVMKSLRSPVVIDCRNLFDGADAPKGVYLGIGKPGHSN